MKDKIIEKQDELRSIIHEVIWQYCYGKGSSDALFNYQDIDAATNEIVEQYFQPEAEAQEKEQPVTDEEFKKGIAEFDLNDLFDDLQKNAYNAEYHNYYYKEANQIIRKHFELKYASLKQPVTDVHGFADRLDEIFDQGMPTKAQIIDAFNKFSGRRIVVSDEEIEEWAEKTTDNNRAMSFGKEVGAKAMRDGLIPKK